jgi:hypothetical protein
VADETRWTNNLLRRFRGTNTQQELRETRKLLAQARRHETRGNDRAMRTLEQELKSIQRRLAINPAIVPYPERLTVQRFRMWSQNEEDGVLLALLEAAGVGPARFVEIGCGTNGGNSGMLASELGFDGLMVDGADKPVAACRRRFPRANVQQAWIERETVDDLVTGHGFGGEVDLLSIDIDGNDIYIWDALTSVQPRIAIAEYNSLMGPEASLAVAYDPQFVWRKGQAGGGYYGASLTAMTRSMAKRGMRLVTTDVSGVNAFFLREDLAPEIPGVEPARVFRAQKRHRLLLEQSYDLPGECERRGLKLVSYE